ncbi:uncharacterized protein BYT42DRAFT_599045 [Radiomyces spectabilis]|uniref:uncharacterized protein n=1 Tax=Radiomyces spectabilis TaxID=64574 RepID=UPI00221F4AC0|nr:uncharacterized protein BYT42DRAFT_599045 [Radiomyces spectabilis]KAI8376076.1 hypothetical protein BYT42DRAFT_599045 [Radiomyces spectabilis]
MPEIAEVEFARRQCHQHCLNRTIIAVDATPDSLVFADTTAEDFAESIKGKIVTDTKRWGKYFVLILDKGPHIVAHFGMTGQLLVKHEHEEKQMTWPPKFVKFIITVQKKGTDEEPVVIAFCDARRLGRVRLVDGDPLKCPPISKLGFDPMHNLPSPEDFTVLVQKRIMPIKALLLDQAFSAGVGNWVADEILYQSRIHPAQKANTLTIEECHNLRLQMEKVCRIAVEAEADSSLFPEDWLMMYRWNKGKGKGAGVLPNGHKLAFETVGGRTSAFVPALQRLHGSILTKRKKVKVESMASDEEAPACIALATAYYITRKNDKRLQLISAKDERVVILGCSSGIGKHVALSYAARGAKLVLFARRRELLDALKQECEHAGASHVTVVAGDVSHQDDLTLLMETCQRSMGGLDTLIYCAGLISVLPFMEACGMEVKVQQTGFEVTQSSTSTSGVDDALERITNVNYYAPVRTARVFLPILIQTSKMPNLAIVSSMAGKVGAPTRAMYAGSKHAVHGFFDSLRVEVEPYNVHVSLVCPATVDTDLRHSAVDGGLGHGGVAGSTSGKLSPQTVALQIIAASDQRKREVYLPAWFGYAALWAKLLASPWVDWFAKRKYSKVTK